MQAAMRLYKKFGTVRYFFWSIMSIYNNAQVSQDAAKEKNIDRAALRWMDTTLSCIECHRFVRNELVVQAPAAKP